VTPQQLVEALRLVEEGKINITVAKSVLEEVFRNGGSPAEIVERKGLAQINDTDAIRALIRDIISANPGPVADYKGGKKKALTFFVGQVMKAMGGKANPKSVNEIAEEELDKA
jgi:aspartyl-tRNA(Asn)/glutamyl-tRNA(Gln) amidotransferase subunit B